MKAQRLRIGVKYFTGKKVLPAKKKKKKKSHKMMVCVSVTHLLHEDIPSL